MARVRQFDSKPELIAKRVLTRLRRRFTTNRRDLPGSPDIVFERTKTAIFVHGCFWHRHRGCKKTTTPKTRAAFWKKKFADNQKRDRRNERLLKRLGWQVFTIWECELSDGWSAPKRLVQAILK
jgi:DNA mismatch endonuclease, patch repair protein